MIIIKNLLLKPNSNVKQCCYINSTINPLEEKYNKLFKQVETAYYSKDSQKFIELIEKLINYECEFV